MSPVNQCSAIHSHSCVQKVVMEVLVDKLGFHRSVTEDNCFLASDLFNCNLSWMLTPSRHGYPDESDYPLSPNNSGVPNKWSCVVREFTLVNWHIIKHIKDHPQDSLNASIRICLTICKLAHMSSLSNTRCSLQFKPLCI